MARNSGAGRGLTPRHLKSEPTIYRRLFYFAQLFLLYFSLMNRWLLKRKVHSSWLIAATCFGVFIGIYFAQFIQVSSIFLLVVSLIVVSIVFLRKSTYLIPMIIFGGIFIGLWRGSISQNDLLQYKPLIGENISISGSVKDDIDTGKSGQIVIRLNKIFMKEKSLPGTLYITSQNADIKRGDKLVLHGKLMKGFGNFSGVIYRAQIDKIIQPKPGDTARVVRDWFADGIRKVIPEPESSLGIGFLVGQRRALPADLVIALQVVGLTHVVVASGYNLTILVRLARRLFEKVSKYLSAVSSVVMILSFIAITGVSPSMARAGLVAGLSLAAWYYGRRFHPIILLSLAIAITVLIDPSYAWGDLGWQLSFAAFAGVMILAPLATRYFFGEKKPDFVRQLLIETVSAQLVTAPIIIMAFGQFSNNAIVSNLLILLFVPFAMLLVFIAGVGSLVLPVAFASVIAFPATMLLKYMTGVIGYLSELPWAMSEVQFSWWMAVICYVAIIGSCLYMWRKTKYNLRDSNLVE